MMLCNAAPSIRTLEVVFDSDWVFCSLNFALAFSNGYVGNICMIHGAKRMKLPAEREAASTFINSMAVIGIGTGSSVTLILRKFL